MKFETGPFSVALPAKSDVNQFPLVGTPLECGELKIRGEWNELIVAVKYLIVVM